MRPLRPHLLPMRHKRNAYILVHRKQKRQLRSAYSRLSRRLAAAATAACLPIFLAAVWQRLTASWGVAYH